MCIYIIAQDSMYASGRKVSTTKTLDPFGSQSASKLTPQALKQNPAPTSSKQTCKFIYGGRNDVTSSVSV